MAPIPTILNAGWSESKVIVRFWIGPALVFLRCLRLTTLKLEVEKHSG